MTHPAAREELEGGFQHVPLSVPARELEGLLGGHPQAGSSAAESLHRTEAYARPGEAVSLEGGGEGARRRSHSSSPTRRGRPRPQPVENGVKEGGGDASGEEVALLSPVRVLSAATTGDDSVKVHVHPMSTARRYYTLGIFTLTAALLYCDQNLLAPNLTQVAREFGFDDVERDVYLGGYVAAAFFAVGAPSALLIGLLADKFSRRKLLFIVVLLGEGPCLATFWVKRYWQLLLLRVLTGISIGGTFPLVFSLAGDLFYVSQRANVAAGVQLAVGVGLALGQGLSGFVGPVLGWRWPFVLVAAPALLVACLMLATTREPQRGCTEASLQDAYSLEGFEYRARLSLRGARELLANRSTACVVLQGLPGSLPWGVLLTFLNDFLAQQKGLSVAHATLVVLAWGVGGAVGVLLGGYCGQRLYNWRRPAMPCFVGVCVAAASLPIWYLINSPVAASWLPLLCAMAFLGGALASPPGPNARAVLLNVNEPERRGLALALQTVLDDLGKGAGPYLVAQMIVVWGRVKAFNVAVAGWIPCGLFFGLCALSLRRDEDALQERLAAKVAAHVGPADPAVLPLLAREPLGGYPSLREAREDVEAGGMLEREGVYTPLSRSRSTGLELSSLSASTPERPPPASSRAQSLGVA